MLLDEGEEVEETSPMRIIGRPILIGIIADRRRNDSLVRIDTVSSGQTELLEIVLALDAVGRFATF